MRPDSSLGPIVGPAAESLRGSLASGMAARPVRPAPVPLGVASVDEAWLGGGLAAPGVHELYAAGRKEQAASLGFALLLGTLRQRRHGQELVWVREAARERRGEVAYGPGLAELGVDVRRTTLLVMPDARGVLRAALEATREAAVSAVVIELSGRQPLLDLTASRRFVLAAGEQDTMVLLVRGTGAPTPSACHTRWRVAAAPSQPLAANAPGRPAFALDLLRQKGGRDGLQLIMEWDRDSASFRSGHRPAAIAPLSRAQPAVAVGGAGDKRRSRAA